MAGEREQNCLFSLYSHGHILTNNNEFIDKMLYKKVRKEIIKIKDANISKKGVMNMQIFTTN